MARATPRCITSVSAAPTRVKLGDSTLLWAFLGQRGRLYARRNVGTTLEPAWRPLVTVTSEAGHVQRLQAVAAGGTVYLFWSR